MKPDEKEIFYIDCTRINGTGKITSRKKESLEEQIIRISKQLPTKQIVLADDVVFSGSVLRKIIEMFESQGIKTIKVISAISTKESYDYFNDNLTCGLRTNFLLGDNIIDQICERDFYFGIAGSGILIPTTEGLKKAPYFEPFGNPVERASIPREFALQFSKGCINRSIELWKDIDSQKREKTKIEELPEPIVGTEKDEEVVKVLRKRLRKI